METLFVESNERKLEGDCCMRHQIIATPGSNAGWSSWRTSKLALVASIWIILALALAACGETPTTAPTPNPSPTVAPPNPQDIAKQSAEKLSATNSLHFVVNIKQGKVQIIPAVDFKNADGNYLKPDKFNADLKVQVLGGLVAAKTIGVGTKQWVIIKGLYNNWKQLGDGQGFNATVLFDPQKGLGAVAQRIQNLKLAGSDTIDGVDCWHLQGIVTKTDIGPLTANTLGKNDVNFDLWTGKQDMLTRQVTFKEITSTANDPNASFWEMHFSQFNEQLTIDAPTAAA